ncbi:MAG: plastocyanin/azurin family copper-binding protein [Thermodesulfobacteriota bacterium]
MLDYRAFREIKLLLVISILATGSLILSQTIGIYETKAEPKVVEVKGLDNFQFSVTEITAKPGEEITVKLVNDSKLPAQVMSHNFVLLKQSTDPKTFNDAVLAASPQGVVPEDMNDQLIANTGQVGGGDNKSVTFKTPSAPGEYIYICTFPGHFAAGMKGKLIIQ